MSLRPRALTGGRGAGQRGGVPVELALGVGVLVLPVAVLVLVLPTWVEHQSMARVAVREAARVAALADSAAQGVADGQAAARQVAANHGAPPGSLDGVHVSVPAGAGGRPLRGARVRATVTVRMPLTAVPVLGDVGGWPLTVSHAELVDPYRSFP